MLFFSASIIPWHILCKAISHYVAFILILKHDFFNEPFFKKCNFFPWTLEVQCSLFTSTKMCFQKWDWWWDKKRKSFIKTYCFESKIETTQAQAQIKYRTISYSRNYIVVAACFDLKLPVLNLPLFIKVSTWKDAIFFLLPHLKKKKKCQEEIHKRIDYSFREQQISVSIFISYTTKHFSWLPKHITTGESVVTAKVMHLWSVIYFTEHTVLSRTVHLEHQVVSSIRQHGINLTEILFYGLINIGD